MVQYLPKVPKPVPFTYQETTIIRALLASTGVSWVYWVAVGSTVYEVLAHYIERPRESYAYAAIPADLQIYKYLSRAACGAAWASLLFKTWPQSWRSEPSGQWKWGPARISGSVGKCPKYHL